MKGIKLGLLGICLGIAGLAAVSNNIAAIALAFVGITVNVAACFIKD